MAGIVAGATAVLGIVATATGWLWQAVKAPGQIEQVYEQQEAIIQYLALDYCERENIPPTECDPEQIPGPGGE